MTDGYEKQAHNVSEVKKRIAREREEEKKPPRVRK
jgi:hypothetical protein